MGFPKTDDVWDTRDIKMGSAGKVALLCGCGLMTVFVDLSEHLLPFFWMAVWLMRLHFSFHFQSF